MSGGFKIQLTGDWERLKRTATFLNTKMRIYAIDKLHEQANKVKPAIEEKAWTLTGKPYDPRREVNSGIWWIETLNLLSSMSVKKVGTGTLSFFVGFEGEHSHGGMAISNSELAEIQESNHPLIEPTWQELEDKFKQEWIEFMQDMVSGRY